MGELQVHPELGSVAFGSGKECWAFSCTKFAQIYAAKFKVEAKKLQERLWGDNYFDEEAKCWRKDAEGASGKQLKRAFVAFIMDPICKLANAIIEGNMDMANKMFNVLGLKLTQDEQKLSGKQLLKAVMSKWINAADTLIEMIICHLPSPREAQKYRTSYLYEGPQDDVIAQSMRECNPKGPLIMYQLFRQNSLNLLNNQIFLFQSYNMYCWLLFNKNSLQQLKIRFDYIKDGANL